MSESKLQRMFQSDINAWEQCLHYIGGQTNDSYGEGRASLLVRAALFTQIFSVFTKNYTRAKHHTLVFAQDMAAPEDDEIEEHADTSLWLRWIIAG